MKFRLFLRAAVLSAILTSPACADDAVPENLRADRESIERIYHAHRLGVQESFEKVIPAADLDHLVRLERKKESLLLRIYHIEITPAMIEAEVARIHATTRAPEILTEIKQALGGDPARFANAIVRPLLTERELRRCFDSDAALHAPQRAQAEQARAALLAGKSSANLTETTWHLASRPADDPATHPNPPGIPSTANAKSKAYTNHASVQRAQSLTPPAPAAPEHEKHYLEDLGPTLQTLLTAQLGKPGDLTSVIDLPTGFIIFQLNEKTTTTISTGTLTVPRRSYEDWISQQH